MLPRHATGNEAHCHEGDAEAFGQLLQRRGRRLCSLLANDTHALLRQLRKVLLGAASFAPALLLHHVVGVRLVVSEEEMRGIAARPIVTGVQDEKTFWNGSYPELPSDAVGRKRCQLPSLLCTGVSNHAVSAPALCGAVAQVAIPRPATAVESLTERSILLDVTPEPVGVWNPQGSFRATHDKHGGTV